MPVSSISPTSLSAVSAITLARQASEPSAGEASGAGNVTEKTEQLREATASNLARGTDAVLQGIHAAATQANGAAASLLDSVVKSFEEPQGSKALLLLPTHNPDADRFNADAENKFSMFLGGSGSEETV